MAIKPFAIQGADLTLGGVNLQAGTTGVVIPGITHATSYKVEEVNDTGDQTQTFTNGVNVAIDQVIYAAKVADAGADVSSYAVYIVYLNDQNYIDAIEVDSRGSYTSGESATNESNNMWEYNGTDSDPINNFVASDWVQVPFRPKMRAGAVVTEGGGGISLPPNTTLDAFNGGASLYSTGGPLQLYSNVGGNADLIEIRVKGDGGDSTWDFKSNGSITFPDSTVQTTAYTGQNGGNDIDAEIVNGSYAASISIDGTVSIPGKIEAPSNITLQAGKGAQAWFNIYGDPTTQAITQWGSSSAYDSQGNLYVVGSLVANSAPFGFGLLLKYSPSGELLWQQGIVNTNTNLVLGESIVIDANDNVHVIASSPFFTGSTSSVSIATIDSQGNTVSQYEYATGGILVPADLAVDHQGNTYICGWTGYSGNSFVAKLDSSGNAVWHNEFGTGQLTEWASVGLGGLPILMGATTIVVDGSYAYITGQYGNPSVIGASTMYTNKINLTDGSVVWSVDTDYPGPYWGLGVDVDSYGNVYTLGGDNNTGENTVTKLDASGNQLWSVNLSPFYFDITAADDGFIYVTGSQYGAPSSPYLLQWAKLDPTGSVVTANQFGSNNEGTGYTWGHRVGGVHDGAVAITGYTTQSPITSSTTFAELLVLQVPTDGGYTSTSTVYDGAFVYATGFNTAGPGLAVSTATVAITSTSSYSTVPGELSVFDLSTATVFNITDNFVYIGGTTVTSTWVFDATGALHLPSATPWSSNILAQQDTYPLLLAYGTNHGGPELDWVNTSTIEDAFNTATIRNVMYINGDGLYIGMNDNAFRGPGFSNTSWSFNPDGTTNFPGFTLTTATGTVNQVLTLDSQGNASWQAVQAAAGSYLQNGSGNPQISVTTTGQLQFSGQNNFVGVTWYTQCYTGTNTVIWHPTNQWVTSAKLTIHAEVETGAGLYYTDFDTQSTELLLAVKVAGNIPVAAKVSVYGSVSTSATMLATYEAQINTATNQVEIICIPDSSMLYPLMVKVSYTETGSTEQERWC